MATALDWIGGARPRTLLLGAAPVVAGTGVAAHDGHVHWVRAALCLVVALALQVGVNYANDYSDGIRGTDADRVGPVRLVGGGLARPDAVRTAALTSFALGSVVGVGLSAVSSWWLLAVGAVAVAAAWGYTGGRRPYGYRALGELAVLVFFGPVAVVGTAYVQTGRVTGLAVLASLAIGSLACTVLVANNLRDIPSDAAAGKRTLAVVLGDARTRRFYTELTVLPYVLALALAYTAAGTALALAALPLAWLAGRAVRSGATGRDLIGTLKLSGLHALAFAALLAVGLAYL